MKCSEICALIEQEYGTEYACDWDNVGLLTGSLEKEVEKIEKCRKIRRSLLC